MDNIFRFADFEADRERYQLWRGTSAIKLERIPFELLFLLLAHSEKLVARTQIVAELWGEDVFLDTERSINTAIRKIRRALGDDAHRPQFIETVVGKGYRFIAPLIPTHHIDNPTPGVQAVVSSVGDVNNGAGGEIWLRGFLVEAAGGTPVLTCDVVVGNIALGRVAIVELELPADVTLPLKPEDRLLLKLHGLRVTPTAKAIQALHAFSISVLQRGLRTRKTDFLRSSADALEKLSPPDAHPNNVGLPAFRKAESAAVQQGE